MDRRAVVLFSGGWESTYCLLQAIAEFGTDLTTPVYMGYKQPFEHDEYDAACHIASQLNTQIYKIGVNTVPAAEDGIFRGRNTTFLLRAVTAFPNAKAIYLGSRAPLRIFDKYGDSNRQYAKTLSKALQVDIRTPCTMLPKGYIKSIVTNAGVPSSWIYSTEGMP